MTKTKLTSYERRVVKFISRKVAWKKRTCRHFVVAMTKFSWKDIGLDGGIEDCSRRLVQTA